MAAAAVEHGWLTENLENESGAFSELLRDDIFAQKEKKQRVERLEDIAKRTEREERWDEFKRSEDEELEYFAKHPEEEINADLDQWQRESIIEIRSQNDARAAREIEESSKSQGKIEARSETPGLVGSEKDEGWAEFSEAWDKNDALDENTLAELEEWRVMQEGEGIAVMAKESAKEEKLKAVSKKVKTETPSMLKESDKVNDVTLGTLVDMAAENPGKALEHAADATVSKAKLIEGLKNKGLKAMGEAKSKEERAEIKRNLEETLRGIEERKLGEPVAEVPESILPKALKDIPVGKYTAYDYGRSALRKSQDTIKKLGGDIVDVKFTGSFIKKYLAGKIPKDIDVVVRVEDISKIKNVQIEKPKVLNTELDIIVTDGKRTLVSKLVNPQEVRFVEQEKPKSKVIPLDRDGNELVDMDDVPIKVNSDGTVTLYHRTTTEKAEDLRKTGKFRSLENTNETFFSNKLEGQAVGYGDAVITVKITPSKTRLDDAFHEGEVTVAVSNKFLSKANIVKVGPTTEAEIVKPEPISETKFRLLENIKSEKGSSELINDLSRLGADAIKRGHKSFKAFSVEMKAILGEAWAKVKHLMHRAYSDAKLMLANERGLIGGVKAKGAPTGQFAKAQKLLDEGKSEKEVWKETGWMKGVERGNVWKFEIDDSGAKWKPGFIADIKTRFGKTLKLKDVFIHPALYKAYPSLKDVKLRIEKLPQGNNGTYNTETNTIIINSTQAVDVKDEGDIQHATRTILLHEIQHVIQGIEGFAKGGSPETFKAIRQRDEKRLSTTIENYNELLSKYAKEGNKKQYAVVLKVRDELTQKAIELQDYFGKKSFEDYQRLAGEIEAREVEIRKNLTKEQRRIMPPYAGAGGIPQDQWIVTDGKDTSFSVEPETEYGKGKKDLRKWASDFIDDLEKPSKTKKADIAKEKIETEKEYAGVKQERTFQETLEPVTVEDYASNRKANKDIKLTAKTNARRVASEIAEGVDKFLGSISTRLGQVSLKLKAKLRKLDFDINTKYADDIKTVYPLLKKAKKMSRNDFADWDYARKNSDVEKINELISKYGMEKEYAAYRKTLDRLRKEGFDVGLVIGEIEEYAPRILKDSRGFLTAIGKAEEWPIYSRKLQERANELGVSMAEMTPDMKADIVSNMILGGWSGLGGIPATKQRVLKKIPADLNKYYMDSDGALMQHLYSMRKGIEARKFFGKIPTKVVEMRKRLYAAQSKIRELGNQLKDNLPKNELEELKKKRNKYIGLEKQYSAYIAKYALQRDYTENIGSYVMELINKKEINPQHERVVNEILNARFHEAGTRGLIQAYKNLSYIDTMGSPISALTQIGDLAWAIYEGGFIRAGKHAFRAAIGKSRITKEDVGVTRIAQEFADSGTLGDAVTKVFKVVGLEKIDSIGKESLLNSALEVYQKQAKNNPAKLKKRIRPIFEAETDSVIEDLVSDEISDNVKLLVYSRLLDFQPVGLSEMPQRYLDAGNGRLFYMLKTFTIKVFDVFRNESYNKIKTGDKAEKVQGIKNLIRLSMIFILANATADELKDWVLGRKTDFSDRAIDNILRLFGVSKFVTWKARTEGVGSALARQILPPFKFIDSAGKDIITAGDEKGLEVVGSIPIVGKLTYWHMGRGVSKRGDLWDRRLRKRKAKLNKIKDDSEKAKDKTAFIHKYKKELRELQAVNRLQGRLNKHRSKINRLKSAAESPERKKSIQKLENERTELIKKFLKGTEKKIQQKEMTNWLLKEYRLSLE
jgi:hypothetical protein